MRLIRVFPRRTKATPSDSLAYIGEPDMFAEADEVHVSVAFTWDLPEAERLEKLWRHVAPTKVGGPALGQSGGEFEPGRYLAPGYVITSRGCPNRCWFCSVWKREGKLRELAVKDGWNVLDDNLLACSRAHIEAVFAMLARQKRRAKFTGGLEAERLEWWMIEALFALKPAAMFFAYDTPDDLKPLRTAAAQLVHFKLRQKYCYVLCGYRGDSFDAAAERMRQVLALEMIPFAMLYRDKYGGYAKDWRRFQRSWVRPAAILARKE